MNEDKLSVNEASSWHTVAWNGHAEDRQAVGCWDQHLYSMKENTLKHCSKRREEAKNKSRYENALNLERHSETWKLMELWELISYMTAFAVPDRGDV